MRKRILNIRFLFVCFIGLISGILFCLNFDNTLLTIILSLTILLFSVGGFIFSNFITNRKDSTHYILKFSSVGLLVTFLLGILITIKPLIIASSLKSYVDNVRVQGVISDYVDENSTSTKFIISDCLIESNGEVDECNYKIVVYTETFSDLKLGDTLLFECSLNSYSFSKDSDRVKLSQGIGYQTYVNFVNIKITNGETSLRDKIKSNTKEILNDNLNGDMSAISFAMIFGEKSGLSDSISDAFSYAGISHILAVSGLHVGVLIALIYFILKKLKLNKYVRLIILTVFLLFYCYLCSYTPSVVRASIMAIVLAITDIIMIEYDGLSSLSIAGILILLFNPLSILSLSFQLSFLSVYSIISFAPSLTRLLNKIKIPKVLSSTLSISIATNIVLLPVCANVFTKVSLLGIFTNIIVIPLFSITYTLTFIILLFAFIIKPLGILLSIPNLFLHLIRLIADFSCSLPFGIIKSFENGYLVVFFLCLAVLILHFLMVRKLIKSAFVLLLTAIISTQMITSNIEFKATTNTIIFNHQYSSNIVFYANEESVTMIGSNIECNSLLYNLKKLKLRNIDNIIAYDLQLNEIDNLNAICKEFDVKKVYIPIKFDYEPLVNDIKNIEIYDKTLEIYDLKYKDIWYNDQCIGIYLDIYDVGDILIPELKPTKAEGKYLSENYSEVKYYYQPNISKNIDFEKLKPSIIINNEDKSYYSLKDLEILGLTAEEGIYEI